MSSEGVAQQSEPTAGQLSHGSSCGTLRPLRYDWGLILQDFISEKDFTYNTGFTRESMKKS